MLSLASSSPVLPARRHGAARPPAASIACPLTAPAARIVPDEESGAIWRGLALAVPLSLGMWWILFRVASAVVA